MQRNEVLKKMDEAASAAASEFASFDPEIYEAIRDWWIEHYLKAGHKRLGRILIGAHPGEES
jgi:hypothetical protein